MKKLIFVLYWLVIVYSGSNGGRTFHTEVMPQFIWYGRWIKFVDDAGKEVYVSSGTNIVIYESND